MLMVTKVTSGVSVSVEPSYREAQSNPEKSHYFFSYKITIENKSGFPVQLLRRHWHIFDSLGGKSEVEGAGVIGEQPQINPGEFYAYESGCNLISDIGSMHGNYLMINVLNKQEFEVQIPRFLMITPYRLN